MSIKSGTDQVFHQLSAWMEHLFNLAWKNLK